MLPNSRFSITHGPAEITSGLRRAHREPITNLILRTNRKCREALWVLWFHGLLPGYSQVSLPVPYGTSFPLATLSISCVIKFVF